MPRGPEGPEEVVANECGVVVTSGEKVPSDGPVCKQRTPVLTADRAAAEHFLRSWGVDEPAKVP